MVDRLYPATRDLYLRVNRVLTQLKVPLLYSPTQFGLVCLYIAGLILLDDNQTNTRITKYLPARCHDALNRLLRVLPFSSRALLGVGMAWIRQQGVLGYLSLDDVIVPKPFSRTLLWAKKLWCPSEKRYVHAMCIVVITWCWGVQGANSPAGMVSQRQNVPRALSHKAPIGPDDAHGVVTLAVTLCLSGL